MFHLPQPSRRKTLLQIHNIHRGGVDEYHEWWFLPRAFALSSISVSWSLSDSSLLCCLFVCLDEVSFYWAPVRASTVHYQIQYCIFCWILFVAVTRSQSWLKRTEFSNQNSLKRTNERERERERERDDSVHNTNLYSTFTPLPSSVSNKSTEPCQEKHWKATEASGSGIHSVPFEPVTSRTTSSLICSFMISCSPP